MGDQREISWYEGFGITLILKAGTYPYWIIPYIVVTHGPTVQLVWDASYLFAAGNYNECPALLLDPEDLSVVQVSRPVVRRVTSRRVRRRTVQTFNIQRSTFNCPDPNLNTTAVCPKIEFSHKTRDRDSGWCDLTTGRPRQV